MNMTNVLHRRGRSQAHHSSQSSTTMLPLSEPPSISPDPSPGRAPWPNEAKVLVSILMVAAVVATIGVGIVMASGDDGATERELRASISTLMQERNAARADVLRIEAELVTARQQLESAAVSGDESAARVVELEARVATLESQLAEALADADRLAATIATLEATVADLEVSVAERDASVDMLEAAVTTANERVVAALASRDALAKLFPLKLDARLEDSAVPGRYGVTITPVHCAGLSSCPLPIRELSIRRTSDGFLRLDASGVVEGGLSRTGGALHLVAGSTTVLPTCNGVPRAAQITMTLFPGSHEIVADGGRSVRSIAGVIDVQAPPVDGCPAVLAFSSVELTARA